MKHFEEFQRYLDDLGLSELSAFEMATVFYEIATNIRLHAELKAGDSVEFSSVLKEERIHLRFADPGKPFDPLWALDNYDPETALKKRWKHGLGLTLVKRIVDSLTYTRYKSRLNVVKLEKRVSRKGE